MKHRDKKNIFTKEEKELVKKLKDARTELFNLKMDLTQNKLKNVKSVISKRKEIAVILTALREKELENAKNA